jgi:Fungal protein kinase
MQSSCFYDDSIVNVPKLNTLLQHDVQDCIMEVGDGITGDLFPENTFSFPINDQFVKNLCGSFISTGKLFDTSNFKNEVMTALFLNQMVTTIAHFLCSMKKTLLKPLCYFTSIQLDTLLLGHSTKVKPDILIVPLINDCIRKSLSWTDIHALFEHTQEKKPPLWMSETVWVKTYMTFCNQPERDFILFVCITKNAFHIVVSDHSGQIATDMIPFDHTASTLTFFRLVMGLAFFPGSNLELDSTIVCQDQGTSSAQKMSELYPPFSYNIPNPNINLFVADSSTTITTPTTHEPKFDDKGDNGIVSISIKDKTCRVIRLLF